MITAIAGGASDASAARGAGIAPKTVRRHRDRDKAFADLYFRADKARRGEPLDEPIMPPPPERPPPPEPEPPEPEPPTEPPPVQTEVEPFEERRKFVEAIACEVVAPAPRTLVDRANDHIAAVEQHLPTGPITKGGPRIGVRELVAKNLSLVDEEEAPPALRTEALKTLNKLYLGPVLDRLMADLTRAPARETAPAEKPKREPGLSKDVVDMVNNAIAGPPVEA